ncbi:MAG: hypothetical protein K2I26_05245 [Paramuribaculum sp.]|nr:hypothetical protein [Paramuribaculum sp.]
MTETILQSPTLLWHWLTIIATFAIFSGIGALLHHCRNSRRNHPVASARTGRNTHPGNSPATH